ncbi:MAG: hypothetical protein KAU94_09005 [Verrucomicrobia bacterium]|nr:hypothetical protein [Verrucomicrobiota bacterium]
MCYVIDSENLLVNYFRSHSEKKRVSIGKLKDLRGHIESQLSLTIYIDITVSSLVDAVEGNPSRFDWRGDYIINMLPDVIEDTEDVNWMVPEAIKDQYTKLVSTF